MRANVQEESVAIARVRIKAAGVRVQGRNVARACASREGRADDRDTTNRLLS